MERRKMLAAGAASLAVLGAGTALAQEKKVPKEDPAHGGPPLSADAAALLLVDHQVGLLSLVGDYAPEQ